MNACCNFSSLLLLLPIIIFLFRSPKLKRCRFRRGEDVFVFSCINPVLCRIIGEKMALALSSSLKAFASPQSWPSFQTNRFVAGNLRPYSLLLPRHSLSTSLLAFSRRRSRNSDVSPSSDSKKKKKKNSSKEDEDEDAFEALFNMLEEDLKNDKSFGSDEDDEDISEEDFEQLQRELEAVLGIGEDDDDVVDVELQSSDATDTKHDNDDDDVDEEEEEVPVKLKNWQMRRLARVLKNGRRKTSIKSLAAELCLDRAVVLELLRDPPPNLVMLSAGLRDEPEPAPLLPEAKPIEITPVEITTVEDVKSDGDKKLPVHVMRESWSAHKRIKKVHLETLERVYRRSKRPTNAMVSSIVQVTNLPRKKVVKWFEDKRNEDEVPETHLPYQRYRQ
ncbi:protein OVEREXPRESSOR OF CATIONIC PEROXIDASE 3 isoform X2 [Mercurialis annua]|uniref:protein OVEREXPRESSOR OF CATIONIC PEROXIDASE 3 isoform X2 n=1 Tax=Mercurialis annua TaxID=3986 RepID=UPI00215E9FB7|nr:protein OVEREXPRESSOR OF CATIONIC PEROXIDASE 3 isoform X2 [Mercurialis annua]